MLSPSITSRSQLSGLVLVAAEFLVSRIRSPDDGLLCLQPGASYSRCRPAVGGTATCTCSATMYP